MDPGVEMEVGTRTARRFTDSLALVIFVCLRKDGRRKGQWKGFELGSMIV